MKNYLYIKGLTLVELMIAIALGAFLSLGIVQMYVSHRLTARNTEGVAQMQDNTRYALSLMSAHARMAGYTGCISRDRGFDTETDESDDVPITNLLNSSDDLLYRFNQAIEGYDDIGATPPTDLSSALTGDPAPEEDTDVLILRGASDNNVAITQNNNASQFFAEVSSTESGACPDGTDRISGLCQEDIVLASDCEKSVVFQITNLQQVGGSAGMNVVHAKTASITPGNSTSSWGGNSGSDMIGTDGEIIKMQTNLYYIGDNNGRPGLYRKVNGSSATLIADNVIDMQVTYGVDTDEDYQVDDYVTAAAVPDDDGDGDLEWDLVRSVRINLLVASDTDNIVGDSDNTARMSFTFNDETFTAPDRRLYRTATNTVVLRNRAE